MQVDIVAAIPAGDNNVGNVDIVTVPAPLSTTGGGVEATALRVTIASDSTGLLSIDDNSGSLTVDAPVATPVFVRLSDGAAAITTLAVSLASVPSHAVTNAGTFAVQDSAILTELQLKADLTETQPVSLASVPSHAVNNAGTFAVQATAVGTIADDATTPGAPVMIGGTAKSPDATDPGNVSAEDDVARFTTDLNRRQYVNTRHAWTWSYHENSSDALTDAAVQADPGDGYQLVITEIMFSTGAATACNIFFEEGSTTILGPHYLEAVAGRGLFWKGEKKVTASTALTVTTSAAIAHGLDVQGYIQKV